MQFQVIFFLLDLFLCFTKFSWNMYLFNNPFLQNQGKQQRKWMNSELWDITSFLFYHFSEHSLTEILNSDFFPLDSIKYSEWNMISKFLSRTKNKTRIQLAREMHLLKNFLISLRQRKRIRALHASCLSEQNDAKIYLE